MSRSFPFIKPCLLCEQTRPPAGKGWLHETKLDGWRGQLHKCEGRVRLYSKKGKDLSFRFVDIVRAVTLLPVDNVVLDGEVTALDAEGRPDFEALQAADANYLTSFWAFDLLRANEEDLRSLPLSARKARLAELLSHTECVHLRYSESFDDAEALLKACASLRLEGIVSKKRDASYRSGPCHNWIKIKTRVWREANRERWKLFEREIS